MNRRLLRNLGIALLVLVAVVAAYHLIDWSAVVKAILKMHGG